MYPHDPKFACIANRGSTVATTYKVSNAGRTNMQCSNSSTATAKREHRRIIIGFDFGSAFTKVVLRDHSRQDSFAVDFGELGHPDNPYLIPSSILICENRYALANYDNAPFSLHSNLKQDALESNKIVPAVAFMALVLRYARDWFIRNYVAIYSQCEIRWELNVGVPSLQIEGDKPNRCRCMARAAWIVSKLCKDNTVLLSDVNTVIEFVTCSGKTDGINVFPEVFAEIATYVKSLAREWGLHTLIDIGAGTVDAVTFILGDSEGEDMFTMLHSDVQPLGAYMIYKGQPASRLPNPVANIRQFEELVMRDPGNGDESVRERTIRMICTAIMETKKRRARISGQWKSGIPLFLCGGGAKMPMYKDDVLTEVKIRLWRTKWGGFNRKSLSMPRNFSAQKLPPSAFHRLAVAHGLSYSIDDLGIVLPPHDIGDQDPRKPAPEYVEDPTRE